MKMAKRSSEEFQEVSEVLCESPNAKIHAEVESLSPMKTSKSCSYRFCSLADCSCFIRLSHDLFHTSVASWLDQYHVASSLETRPQKLRPHN